MGAQIEPPLELGFSPKLLKNRMGAYLGAWVRVALTLSGSKQNADLVTPLPPSLGQTVFSENRVVLYSPHENLYIKRDFRLP